MAGEVLLVAGDTGMVRARIWGQLKFDVVYLLVGYPSRISDLSW